MRGCEDRGPCISTRPCYSVSRPRVPRGHEDAHIIARLGVGVVFYAHLDYSVIAIIQARRARDSSCKREIRGRPNPPPGPRRAYRVCSAGCLATHARSLELVVRLIECDNARAARLVARLPDGQRDAREGTARRVVISNLEGAVRHTRGRGPRIIDAVPDTRVRRGVDVPVRVECRLVTARYDEVARGIVRRADGFQSDETGLRGDVRPRARRSRTRTTIERNCRAHLMTSLKSLMARSSSRPSLSMSERVLEMKFQRRWRHTSIRELRPSFGYA